MKKRGKRLLSVAMASAMSLSMITGWAANTVEIESIILNPGASEVNVTQSVSGGTLIDVTPSDVVQVTVSVKEGTTAKEVEATFLSAVSTCFSNGEGALTALDNGSIQYVDQKTTSDSSEGGTDYKAVFTFRPRVQTDGKTPLVSGTNTAKLGGTDVAKPEEFSYNVKKADVAMTLAAGTGATTTFTAETAPEAGIAYTISVATGETLPTALSSVKIGTNALETADYTYSSGTLTLTQTKLNTLAAGTYALTVTADGYKEATLTNAIVVNAKQTNFDKETSDTIKEGLDDLEISGTTTTDTEVNTATVTMPEKVSEQDISYSVADATQTPAGVTITNNTITLDTTTAPFAAVDVVAYVGKDENGADIQKQETVYIIPEGTHVSYGNVGLMTTEGSNDTFIDAFSSAAFSSESDVDQAFVNAMQGNSNKLYDEAKILNLALNNITGENSGLPHFTDAIDYNKDGKLALAEFRIYKLLISGADMNDHTFTKINNARQGWVDSAASSTTGE